jgi:hypothetical protein
MSLILQLRKFGTLQQNLMCSSHLPENVAKWALSYFIPHQTLYILLHTEKAK